MNHYPKLSLNEAKAIVAEYDALDDVAFSDLVQHWKVYELPAAQYDPSFEPIRRELVSAFKGNVEEADGKAEYLVDLRVGLKLYELFPIGSDFTLITANDDDFWRYLSLKVIPDITYLRYPDPKQGDIRINRKRFYAHTRRIWIKTLWWYIYLSWQGNGKDTFDILRDNGTDNINKLIETPGRGYRIGLFREMMREYHLTRPHVVKDFAAFTKLNNAKCVTVEPELTSGGVRAYAQKLLVEIADRKEDNPDESD